MGKIELTQEEANYLLECINLALKTEGLSVAKISTELAVKIKESFEENKKS